MKLSTKANLVIAALAVVLFAPLSGIMIHRETQHIRWGMLHALDDLANGDATLVRSFVEDAQMKAGTVAAAITPEMLEPRARPGLAARLTRLNETLDFGSGIFLLDAQGRLILDAPQHRELWDHPVAFPDYFQWTRTTHRGVMSDPYISERTGRPVLTFTAPILSAGGDFLAMVGCSYDLLGPGVLRAIREQRAGRNGFPFIMDTSRLMLLHPDAERVLQRDVPPGANPLLDRALAGFEGGGTTVNSRGVPMLASFARVVGTSWIVGFEIPQAEAEQGVAGFRRMLLLSTTFGMLVLMGVAMLVIRKATGPLHHLEQAVRAIIRLPDDQLYGHDVLGMLGATDASDEIGTFARAFRELLMAKRHSILQLRRAAAEWEMAFDAVTEAMLCIDAEGRVVRLNRTASDWLRIAPEAAIGQDAKRLLLGERDPARFWPESIRLDPTRPFSWTGPMPHQEGVFEFRMAPLTQQGVLQGVVLAVHDVTEQTQRVDIIRKQAFYDSLTGLPNRIMILDRLEHGLARTARCGHSLGLLFLDLDHFTQVNDLHGHDAGDALLREAAHRMAAVTRKGDTIGRLGGDEFVMILSDLGGPEAAALVASKVIQTLATPFIIAGASLQIGTSIGIALAPADGTEAAILLKLADAAMYAAKKGGRSTFRLASELPGATPLFLAAEEETIRAVVQGEPAPAGAPEVSPAGS